MLSEIFNPYRLERPVSDMKRNFDHFNSALPNFFKYPRRKVKAGGWCGDRAALASVDRLVAFTVRVDGVLVTFDVWRQRSAPVDFDRLANRSRRMERNCNSTIIMPLQNATRQFGPECDRPIRGEPSGGLCECQPARILMFLHEKDLNR